MKSDNLDIFDKIMGLPVLRVFRKPYNQHKSVLLYLFFGGLTTVISIGTFIIFDSYLKMDVLVANLLSWVCAVSFAYVTNRVWVFSSRATGKAMGQEILSFVGGRLATLGFEELVLWVFVSLLDFNSTLIKILAQVGVLILNYVISKLFVFKK